ncbi:ABC transporter substrate-binding protein [Arcobacter arenosus]|uniref:ABC transporter substrate-binding protein n=1 Tax=Arcobacter arenosus TaxID=2576037 RepID=UPI003BAA0F20
MNFIRLIIFSLLITSELFSSQNLEKVTLQLNWKYQFEFAGFIAAKEKGFYKDLGLDVQINEFVEDINVIDEVKNDRATFGLYDTSYLNLYDEKKPIVLVANYFKKSALVFVTKQDIIVPEDLKGKKVMYLKNELKDSLLGELLKKHKIKQSDFISVDHDFTGEKFINGEVDAFSAFVSNELYHVKKSQIPYRIIDPENYGIIGGGLNLFTSYSNAKKNPLMVQKFLEATNKGWNYAFDNKEEISDIIIEKYSKIKSKDALLFEAKETEKLMMTAIYKVGEIIENVVNQDILRSHSNIPLDKLLFNKIFTYSNIDFSEKEKEYIKKKKEIKVCIDPNWMPYEMFNEEGKHIGMTADFLKLISEKTNLEINVIPTKTWSDSLNLAKQRKCDILSLAQETPSRLKYLKFTSSYINFPVVIATSTEKFFLPNPEDIIEKEKVGIVKGYSMGEYLKNKYPNNKIVDVNNIKQGLEKVQSGELYGFVDSLPTIAYVLQHEFIDTLKITGKFDRKFDLGIAVRNDDELLYEIIQKAIESIPHSTMQEIFNRYISVKVESSDNFKYLFEILGIFLIIIIIAYFRNRQLKKYNNILSKTQKKLETSLESFEILLDSVNEGVFVFDENGKCLQSNKIAAELFGFENKDQVIGQHIKDFVSPKSYDLVAKNIKTDQEDAYEIIVQKKDGEEFHVLAKGKDAILDSKRVRISSVIDLTELKQKDKLLSQQSKMAAMGEMIENIAHQWRQPLSLVSSIATGIIVKKELGVTDFDDEKKDLEKINNTAQHLSQTIEDFRNFFKTDKEKKEFSVLKSIEKNLMLIEGILKSNNIQMIFEQKDDCKIKSYENEFTQALLNIFYNSKDALKDKTQEEKLIFVNVKSDKENIIVTVLDNGGGIKNSIVEKIFDPYFTTKHQAQGTGIGLYMTHQIIEKHMGGKIIVENEKFEYNNTKYKGAKFSIYLPLK